MIERILSFSFIKSLLIELLIGYVVIFIIGYLIMLPGKDKIQSVANKNEREEAKIENMRVGKWLCFGWTIAVVIFNVYLILI